MIGDKRSGLQGGWIGVWLFSSCLWELSSHVSFFFTHLSSWVLASICWNEGQLDGCQCWTRCTTRLGTKKTEFIVGIEKLWRKCQGKKFNLILFLVGDVMISWLPVLQASSYWLVNYNINRRRATSLYWQKQKLRMEEKMGWAVVVSSVYYWNKLMSHVIWLWIVCVM